MTGKPDSSIGEIDEAQARLKLASFPGQVKDLLGFF
jgi:hypothetical protein